MHKAVFLRKAINLIILLSFFYCKQEHNLKTDDNREQNKTSLPSTVSHPENPLCCSLALEPSFLQVSHISLEKYLPTSKLSHYCSQIAHLLKSKSLRSDFYFLLAGSDIFRILLQYLDSESTKYQSWGNQAPVKPSTLGTFGQGGDFSLQSLLFPWGTEAGWEKGSSKMRWEELFSAVSIVASALLQEVMGIEKVFLRKSVFDICPSSVLESSADWKCTYSLYNHPTFEPLEDPASLLIYLKSFMPSLTFKLIKEKKKELVLCDLQ